MAMNIRRNCSILSLRKLILIGLKPTMLVLIPLTVISLDNVIKIGWVVLKIFLVFKIKHNGGNDFFLFLNSIVSE